ncbi:RQC-minor-2 family DNA-binding protein [Metabacillus mangrovi]|nr:RQC-minor-2 family DNA-binding protein [Metabacillus mangrovi]
MSLTLHARYFDSYPLLAVLPLGKKNKEVRSVGHKTERALLNRVQEALDGLQPAGGKDIQQFLKLEGKAYFPVFLNRGEEVHPHFMKPEFFLWNDFSSVHGIPKNKEAFYDENFADLSKTGLSSHIEEVLRDYRFLARVAMKSKAEWESEIEKSYDRHPFVMLARDKEPVIQAVEKMNRSSLLSLLSPPEETAFWRHRVEIVMRPYRELPEPCEHEKVLSFDSEREWIIELCEDCGKKKLFHVEQKRVELEEEPDMDKAVKRIATIERQFNELAGNNVPLIEALEKMVRFKHKLSGLDEVLRLKESLSRRPVRSSLLEDPFLSFAERLQQTAVPQERPSSALLWFAQFRLPDVALLKEVRRRSLEEAEQELQTVKQKLEQEAEQSPYDAKEVCLTVKGKDLTFEQVFSILQELGNSLQSQPLHLIAQLLKGRTSSQIRGQEWDQTPLYGYLSSWEEKDIQKAFKKLEKEGWIEKQTKGYEALIQNLASR